MLRRNPTGHMPEVSETAFIDPTAIICGKVIIEDNVFIGSDTQLIAPVVIKKGATIGAGSTITEDAPENKLTLSRVKQKNVDNWIRPKKK